MPTNAKFRTIPGTDVPDNPILLPDPNSGINDRHWPPPAIEFPRVNPAFNSVLFLRVRPRNTPIRLFVNINSETILTLNFTTTGTRSLHEIMGPNILRESDNTMTLSVTGSGQIEISDVVVLYEVDV
jgi:hypothetical protein